MFPSSPELSPQAIRISAANHWLEFLPPTNNTQKRNKNNCITHHHTRRITMSILSLISILLLAIPCNGFTSSPIGRGYIQKAQSSLTSSSSSRRHFQFSASAAVDNTPSSYEMSNFAKRMKNIISKDRKKVSKEKTNSKAPRNLLRIKTLEDFKQLLSNQQGKIVVVRWYAPWCKVRTGLCWYTCLVIIVSSMQCFVTLGLVENITW